MINTVEIAERLSRSFGPEQGRELASVLELYHHDLRENVFQNEFRQVREAIRDLAEAQRRTEERIDALAEAQKRTEERIDALAEAQTQTEALLQKLIIVVQAHEVRLAKLDGRTLESQFREKASAYLGRVLRGTRVIAFGDLADELDGVLTEDELDELSRADVILRGRALFAGLRQEVYAVVEVSVTVDQSDVERAARRAALLRKKGWKSLAVAAGEEVPPPIIQNAASLGVAILEDGKQYNWPEALAAA
jgi:hypothetical protein